MAAPQAYVHPPDNPLLAPLNQLGTSIDTNYTNSWTLRELIRTNAQYILDQLGRIEQSTTALIDQFVANRNMVVQLQNTINDLQDQLAVALAAGQAVQALQQQIADLTAQRDDYVRWINDSLGLINRYNAYVQHINGLQPDNAEITNLITQINQRLRQITDLFGSPPQAPPGAPGPPPPYNGQGGPGGQGGQGGILSSIGNAFGNVSGSNASSASNASNASNASQGPLGSALNRIVGSSSSASNNSSSAYNPSFTGNNNSSSSSSSQQGVGGPRRNRLSPPPPPPLQSSVSTNLANQYGQSSSNFSGVNPMRSQSNQSNPQNLKQAGTRVEYNVGDMVNFTVNGRPINGRITAVSPFDDTYTIQDPRTSTSYPDVQYNNISRKFQSSFGGRRKRTRKHTGGWRLSSNKKTSTRTRSKPSRSSRSSRSSRTTSSSSRPRRSRRSSK